MKKFFAIFALFCAIVLVSCSKHTVATISVSKDEKLKTEGMRVWSRPIEIGFQVSGSIEGSADNKGSKPIAVKGSGKTSVNLFSGNKSIEIDRLSPLAKLAAFNAIQTAKADGMVIFHTDLNRIKVSLDNLKYRIDDFYYWYCEKHHIPIPKDEEEEF